MQADLARAVAALDYGTPAEADEAAATGRPGEQGGRRSEPEPEPEPEPVVILPRRTTPGGDFGPAVREKLTRIALAKRR